MNMILIVEDNDTFRHALRNLLHSRFPAVDLEEAQDGTDVMQKIDEFHPDLIFMDLRLPGESGLELTKQIKDEFPETIIILLTNYDLPEYRAAADESGANYFLGKGSSTAEEILELVDSVLYPATSFR
jgi:two-component system response regulator YesN